MQDFIHSCGLVLQVPTYEGPIIWQTLKSLKHNWKQPNKKFPGAIPHSSNRKHIAFLNLLLCKIPKWWLNPREPPHTCYSSHSFHLKSHIALCFNKRTALMGCNASVHPWDGNPLRRGGGTLQGLLHNLHALVHVVVDENHIEVLSVRVQDGLRLFLDHLQVFGLGNTVLGCFSWWTGLFIRCFSVPG